MRAEDTAALVDATWFADVEAAVCDDVRAKLAISGVATVACVDVASCCIDGASCAWAEDRPIDFEESVAAPEAGPPEEISCCFLCQCWNC